MGGQDDGGTWDRDWGDLINSFLLMGLITS